MGESHSTVGWTSWPIEWLKRGSPYQALARRKALIVSLSHRGGWWQYWCLVVKTISLTVTSLIRWSSRLLVEIVFPTNCGFHIGSGARVLFRVPRKTTDWDWQRKSYFFKGYKPCECVLVVVHPWEREVQLFLFVGKHGIKRTKLRSSSS